MHQLIVIGNGFDLSCGLKSSFSDFHKYRFSEDEEGYTTPPQNPTVWDYILQERRGCIKDWANVEECVREWVLGDDGHERLIFSLPKCVTNPHVAPEPELNENPVYFYIFENWLKTEPLGERELGELFLRDLNRYEKLLSIYLNDKVKKTPGYHNSVETRIKALCEDLLDPDRLPPASVLSFNYTEAIDAGMAKRYGIEYICNVHGTSDRMDAVIGIDGTGVRSSGIAGSFTKAYRLLSRAPVERGMLFEPDASRANLTDLVKFFGHSLADADYSYFQALFDAIDLYAGDTRLVFYYRPYEDCGDLQEEISQAVANLLRAYGETLDNQDHGRNLMRKLLLEGRLMIRDLSKCG